MTNKLSLNAEYIKGLGNAQTSPFQHAGKAITNIKSNFTFTICLIKCLHCITYPLFSPLKTLSQGNLYFIPQIKSYFSVVLNMVCMYSINYVTRYNSGLNK